MELFSELGVKVVSGQRFLAGYMGDHESTKQYIQQQVLNWVTSRWKPSHKPQAAMQL